MKKTIRETDRHRRLRAIGENLRRGDVTRIAALAGVTREWASYVLNGHEMSEKVLRAAEELIAERKQVNEIN